MEKNENCCCLFVCIDVPVCVCECVMVEPRWKVETEHLGPWPNQPQCLVRNRWKIGVLNTAFYHTNERLSWIVKYYSLHNLRKKTFVQWSLGFRAFRIGTQHQLEKSNNDWKLPPVLCEYNRFKLYVRSQNFSEKYI